MDKSAPFQSFIYPYLFLSFMKLDTQEEGRKGRRKGEREEERVVKL